MMAVVNSDGGVVSHNDSSQQRLPPLNHISMSYFKEEREQMEILLESYLQGKHTYTYLHIYLPIYLSFYTSIYLSISISI